MTDSSERLGVFVGDLAEAVQRNPISAALIGMGAVWLFTSHTRSGEELVRRSANVARDAWEGTSSNFRSRAENVQNAARDAANTIRERGGEVADQVTQAGRGLAHAAADYADDLPNQAGSLLDDVRDNLRELFRSQPLAIGAVGLAIGAAIAASFPTTETETDYLGETSDFVKDKASEFAGEQVERVTEVGKKVAAAVADEAQQQGLTGEGLKAAATDLSNKASRVAQAAAGA
jgi:hypothetical protein